MRLLDKESFLKICGKSSTPFVPPSFFNGFKYECVCGSTHKFQDEHTIHICYQASIFFKTRLTVSCPDKIQHLTLLETKLREEIFPEGFVSKAGYIAGNTEFNDYENEYCETLNAEPWIQNLWSWEDVNGVSFLPRNKYDLVHLQDLSFGSYSYLEKNDSDKILELPKEFFRLSHLKQLHLGSAINPELYLTYLTELPEELGQLTHLECLCIQFNNLRSLPVAIGNLINLKDLKLGGNKLKTLPQDIGNLKSLEILTLWRNDLVSLPEEIGELQQLKGLDIASNPLRKLPETIVNLTNLKSLNMENGIQLSNSQKNWLNELTENGCDIYLL